MSNQIQFRRGVESNRGSITPSAGEPVWITDNKKLYIGDGLTPGGIDIFKTLGSAITKNAGVSANEVLVLDAKGKVPESVLPSLAISEISEVASQSAMLALAAQTGDIAVRSDLNKTYILKASPATVPANWVLLRTPTDSVLSVNGKTGALSLTKVDVGLSNVTNESKSSMFSSPEFTGNPTVPTQPVSTNNTRVANTSWVRTYVSSLGLAVEGGTIDGGTF